MVQLSRWSWCLLSCVIMVSGCRSTGNRSSEIAPSPAISETDKSDVQVAPWDTATFFHNREFQTGTGAVDAGDVPPFTATDSGLRYRILRSSSREKPTAASTVSVNYRGWLHSGKIFDSSYERGEPTTFPLSNVIAGWTEGMQYVGEGGMIELWVPSKLGYGANGSPGSIPPHSHLHFIIELVNVH